MTSSPRLLAAVVISSLAAIGCETPELPETPPGIVENEAAEEPAERPMVAGAPGKPLPEIAVPVTNDPRPFLPTDPIFGRRSRRAGGYMGTTMAQIPNAKHKVVIFNVKRALNLYEASHGEYPQSHEEFMDKIIKFNKIKLPELEPEHRYIYVPEEPKVGLQIVLKQSKSTEEPPAEVIGGREGEAPAEPPAEPPAESAAEPTEPEYVPTIRERAAAFGGASPTDPND